MQQPHKMVKHTQTIRRLLPTNCLSVFVYFMRLALKVLRMTSVFLKKFYKKMMETRKDR